MYLIHRLLKKAVRFPWNSVRKLIIIMFVGTEKPTGTEKRIVSRSFAEVNYPQIITWGLKEF